MHIAGKTLKETLGRFNTKLTIALEPSEYCKSQRGASPGRGSSNARVRKANLICLTPNVTNESFSLPTNGWN